MDSLKEKDTPASNPSKRPRIEVDEELMRQMIAGQAPLDSEVVRRIPEPEEEDTNALEENTSETVSGASAPVSYTHLVALFCSAAGNGTRSPELILSK